MSTPVSSDSAVAAIAGGARDHTRDRNSGIADVLNRYRKVGHRKGALESP
jgi:hypothetical protein